METSVRESILTKFAELVGDEALQSVYGSLYASGTFKFIMFTAVFAAVIAVGVMFHLRRPVKYPFVLFIAFVFMQPFNSKPFGFVLLDTFARLTGAVIDQGVVQFTANSTDPNSSTNMHPGLVMDMFTAAAATQIKDPATREMLHQFLAKCMDNALTKDGEPAVYDDLFNFGASYHKTGDTVALSFTERKLDERALENDDSIAEVRPGTNCKTALTEVRAKIVEDLSSQPMTVADRVMTGRSGTDPDKMQSTDKWFNNWQNSGSPFLNLARNVRIGVASQYEKSKLINELGWDNWWFGNYYKSTNMDPSLREMMLGMGSSAVDAGFQFSNIRELPARLTGNRWAFSLGAEMKELKEKLELLPYYLVVIKNVLKIMCPFFIFTIPMFGRFQYFTIWAGSWVTVTVTPSIVTAMRSMHNSIILSKLGITSLQNEVLGHKTLAAVVNVEQTKALMEDYIPLAYAMMKEEIAIIGLLAGAIIAGSWYAGMLGNGMVGWLGSSITGQLMGNAIGGTIGSINATVQTMTATFAKSESSGGGLRNSAANEPPTSPTFSNMFARKDP